MGSSDIDITEAVVNVIDLYCEWCCTDCQKSYDQYLHL